MYLLGMQTVTIEKNASNEHIYICVQNILKNTTQNKCTLNTIS